MSKSYNQDIRFRIIDRELRRWPKVTTARLVKVISEALDKTVEARTIQKDIEAMKHDKKLGFDAPIEYDKRTKSHYYADRTYSITNFNLGEKDIRALKFYAECLKLYSQYSIFSDFTSAIEKVVEGVDIKRKLGDKANHNLLIQTDTARTPGGAEHISTIVDAIVDLRQLRLSYQKFNDTNSSERVVNPYMLKEYKNRWYLLAVVKGKDQVTTFALDRIKEIAIAATSFERTIPFDAETYFKYSFGITALEGEPQTIRLHFNPEEAHYIKSLPIHPTQETLSETDSGLVVSIQIVPSYEFYEFILGKTPDVTVLSPENVVSQVEKHLKTGLKNYNKKNINTL